MSEGEDPMTDPGTPTEFGRARAMARQIGALTFHYRGQEFSTRLDEEPEDLWRVRMVERRFCRKTVRQARADTWRRAAESVGDAALARLFRQNADAELGR